MMIGLSSGILPFGTQVSVCFSQRYSIKVSVNGRSTVLQSLGSSEIVISRGKLIFGKIRMQKRGIEFR